MRLKRARNLLLLVTGVVAMLLVVGFTLVRAKESHASSAVLRLRGMIGSVPRWPLGTEYYLPITRPLTGKS